MRWNRWYAIRSYFRSALWTVPLLALVVELFSIRLIARIDQVLDWVPRFGVTVAEASEGLSTIETLTISFIVFTFGSMLVAIQVASGQLTPRIIATALLRDNVIRFTVGLFVFTLLFAIGAKARLEPQLPAVMVLFALCTGIGSVTAFLFLIDYTARLLRPTAIVQRIAAEGMTVIESVYPNLLEESRDPRQAAEHAERPARSIEHLGQSAVVLAINIKALVALAKKVDGVIEFAPRVGNFVTTSEPLFRLYGNAAGLSDDNLRSQVAFGPERTIEQDSTFAFRIIVDVAIKALSQAINDPTTAVLAIDQLHRLLRTVGRRHLHDDAIHDETGALRLILPTPNWEEFVELALSEIRLYGAGNFQIARRLRAMLEDLLALLPEVRHRAVRRQLDALDATLVKLYPLEDDLRLARHPDMQGLGGGLRRPQAR